MTSSSCTICKSTRWIFIGRITLRKIFRTNISNNFTRWNCLSYIYNVIRRNMTIWNLNFIVFNYYSMTTGTFKTSKYNCSRNYRIYSCSFRCRNIYSRMIRRCTLSWRISGSKIWRNFMITRKWPKKIIVWKIVIGIWCVRMNRIVRSWWKWLE